MLLRILKWVLISQDGILDSLNWQLGRLHNRLLIHNLCRQGQGSNWLRHSVIRKRSLILLCNLLLIHNWRG